MRLWTIGSVDIMQIDNESHSVGKMDFENDQLKHAFISFDEKRGVGSVEQLACLRKSIISLYPANVHANVDSILQLIQAQAHRDVPVSDDEHEKSIHWENNEMADKDSLFNADDPFWMCSTYVDLNPMWWFLRLAKFVSVESNLAKCSKNFSGIEQSWESILFKYVSGGTAGGLGEALFYIL